MQSPPPVKLYQIISVFQEYLPLLQSQSAKKKKFFKKKQRKNIISFVEITGITS